MRLATEYKVRVIDERKSALNKSTLSANLQNWREKKMRILAVDDDTMILGMLQTLISYHGYDISTMSSGKDAAFLLARPSHTFDLLLLDINMPDMTGIDILNFLDKLDKGIRVIIITGDADCKYERDIKARSNVIGFVLKPFDPRYLIHAIKDAEKTLGRVEVRKVCG